MAISLVGSTNYTDGTVAGAETYSHTTSSGSNLALVVVAICDDAGGGKLTGLSYNGSSLTLKTEAIDSSADVTVQLWYLANPSVGTYNIVVDSTSESITDVILTAYDFSGVDQTTPIDATASNETSTSPTVNITTNNANSYIVAGMWSNQATGTKLSADSPATERYNSDYGVNTAGVSDRSVTTATSYTMSWTDTDNDETTIMLAGEIKEAGAGDDHTISPNDISLSLTTDNTSTSYEAISYNLLTSSYDNVDRTSYTTASVSPTKTALVFLVVSTSGNVEPTVTGGGMTTWELVRRTTNVLATNYNMIFMAQQDTPSSGAITINFGTTQTGAHWHVIEFINTRDGNNGKDAIRQTSANFAFGAGTTAQVSLNTFYDTDNATFGTLRLGLNEAITEGSGFTQIAETNGTAPATSQSSMFKSSNDTTVDWSWTTSNANWSALAVELIHIASDIDFLIAPTDISHSLTTDNTTVDHNHVLPVDDITLSLTEDNTTITQNHVIASTDLALSLTTDNTTITQNHVVAVNDIALSLTEDNTTVAQNHNLTVQDIAISLSEDNATINQNHVLAIDDISLTLTEDNTTINQNHVLSVQDIALALTEDNATLDLSVQLTVQDIALGLSTDNTTINQSHVLSVNDISLSLSTDNTTITQNHIIASADMTLSLTTDNTTVAETGEVVQPGNVTTPITVQAQVPISVTVERSTSSITLSSLPNKPITVAEVKDSIVVEEQSSSIS